MRSSRLTPAPGLVGLVAAVLLCGPGCASTAITAGDDQAPTRVTAGVIEGWRADLVGLETREIRGVDKRAFERVRSWIDRLEAGGAPERQTLLVAAIKGELEVMQTAEKRFGTSGSQAPGRAAAEPAVDAGDTP